MTNSMETINERRKAEVDAWCKRAGGIITPEALVDLARDPQTACHSWFTWSDDDAAEKYRIIEARGLLRVLVTVIPTTQQTVRAFVSLAEDRKAPSGGYRPALDTLTTPEQRKALIRTAYMEFTALRRRWQALHELSAVFEALDHVETQLGAGDSPKAEVA